MKKLSFDLLNTLSVVWWFISFDMSHRTCSRGLCNTYLRISAVPSHCYTTWVRNTKDSLNSITDHFLDRSGSLHKTHCSTINMLSDFVALDWDIWEGPALLITIPWVCIISYDYRQLNHNGDNFGPTHTNNGTLTILIRDLNDSDNMLKWHHIYGLSIEDI